MTIIKNLVLFIGCLFLLPSAGTTQHSSVPALALSQFLQDAEKFKEAEKWIDSISTTTHTGNVFSAFYTLSMKNIRAQANSYQPGGKEFIEKFMHSFAIIFLSAWEQDQKNTLVKGSVWWNYFNHPNALTWQMVIAGVNAHINGDMWKALAFNFSEKELLLHKKEFLRLQKALQEVLNNFYSSLVAENNYMRKLTKFTRELPLFLANRILYKWRSRQMKLAVLYHTDRVKFDRLLSKVDKKKNRNDEIIYKER